MHVDQRWAAPRSGGIDVNATRDIDLGGEVKVEAHLTEADPAALATGMEMELVVVPFGERDGDEVVTFAFRPVG